MEIAPILSEKTFFTSILFRFDYVICCVISGFSIDHYQYQIKPKQ